MYRKVLNLLGAICPQFLPKKNIIIAFLKYNLVLSIYIICGILFYGNHDYVFPVVIFITPIIVFIGLKKNRSNFSNFEPLKYIASLLILLLTASVLNDDFSRSLSYLISLPIIAYLGILWYRFNYLILILITALTYFFSIFLFPTVFSLAMEKRNSYEIVDFPKIKFLNHKKDTVHLNSRYTVLDFWNTKCAICYKKFPYFDELSKKYQSEKIAFYSVNVLLKGETINQVSKIVDSLDYSYMTIYANSVKTISDSLGFKAYPRVIILKGNKAIYSGWLNTENNIFGNKFEKRIKELN